MLNRDELTIDLANKYIKKYVLEFLELGRRIFNLQRDKEIVKREYEEKLKTLNDEIRELRDSCVHPHTYLTSGGQYESQTEICSICEKEL